MGIKYTIIACALSISILCLIDAQSGSDRPELEITVRENLTVRDFPPPKGQIIHTSNLLGDDSGGSAPIISWYSISSGASSVAGQELELSATIGQVGAGVVSGGNFLITGGFAAGFQDSLIFSDGFETGDLQVWSHFFNI